MIRCVFLWALIGAFGGVWCMTGGVHVDLERRLVKKKGRRRRRVWRCSIIRHEPPLDHTSSPQTTAKEITRANTKSSETST